MERYESSRKPRKCPACGSSLVALILYGLSGFSPELEADLEAGRVVLGGCCLTGDDPKWQCMGCGTPIYQKVPEMRSVKPAGQRAEKPRSAELR